MSKLIPLIWPFVLKFLMSQGSEYAASYLESRRQRRLGIGQETDLLDSDDEMLPVADEYVDSPVQIVCAPPPSPSFFNSDAFWFTLSGITLGIALSTVAAIIKRAIGKQ